MDLEHPHHRQPRAVISAAPPSRHAKACQLRTEGGKQRSTVLRVRVLEKREKPRPAEGRILALAAVNVGLAQFVGWGRYDSLNLDGKCRRTNSRTPKPAEIRLASRAIVLRTRPAAKDFEDIAILDQTLDQSLGSRAGHLLARPGRAAELSTAFITARHQPRLNTTEPAFSSDH